jgi:hypothetical protein
LRSIESSIEAKRDVAEGIFGSGASQLVCADEFLHLEEGTEIALVDPRDENNPLWDTFRIETVPTVILLKDREIILERD